MEFKNIGKDVKRISDCSGNIYFVKPGEVIDVKEIVPHPELEEVKKMVKKTKVNKIDEDNK